jgi:hypothetical protein
VMTHLKIRMVTLRVISNFTIAMFPLSDHFSEISET